LEDTGVNGKIILKWISRKWNGRERVCVAKDKDSWRDLRGVIEPSSALQCDPRSYSCSRSPDHVKYYKAINMDFFLPSSLQQVETEPLVYRWVVAFFTDQF
jgi:hypothetical protein